MAGSILVEFYSTNLPLKFSGIVCNVEDLIVECCKYLQIGPVGRHLFSLWDPTSGLWYPLCKKFDLSTNISLSLYLRVRFKTPNVMSLKVFSDSFMLSYMFYQARNDFMEGRIFELCSQQVRENALGLVATDIICYLLENNLTPETMKIKQKDFIPQKLTSKWDLFLKDPLEKAVNRGWKNSRQNLEFVKELYLETLDNLVPDYGCEVHSGLIDEGGKVYEVEVAVNPYHPQYPGIRMKIKKSKDDWILICGIEDLCYISMRDDKTVEISRKNGIPQYIQFQNKDQMDSFVSLLDGYYRLSEKWTFNLCKDLPTPSLQWLRSIKCHGPVDHNFAYKKLEEKSNNEVGCYILRESNSKYNELFVDVWNNPKSAGPDNIITVKMKKQIMATVNLYSVEGCSDRFSSISELLAHISKEKKLHFRRCIPPSEYDKSNILLCQKEHDDAKLKSRSDCSCSAQCIPHDAIYYPKNAPVLDGKHTVVSVGRFRQSCTDTKLVAVKMLRKETKVSHLQEFLSQSDKILFWQHDAIVSSIGMILSNPTAFVLEFFPIGSLSNYLQQHQGNVHEVDLVEAAFDLARALWYLDEQRTCHGNIRCHNIMVAAHTDSCFKIKLSDPGLISYSDADVHWIPLECFNDYSKASKSIFADVYAYGTTLWQIFMYGARPLPRLSGKEAKEFYLSRSNLTFPSNCNKEIEKVVQECWQVDQDSRKRPQSIVRDVNQILYQVYNSRRTSSYAVIHSASIPPENASSESQPSPPVPLRRPPPAKSSKNILKNVFKWSGKGFSYNNLSQSKSTVTNDSSCTATSYLTDRENTIAPESSNSLISISETIPQESFYDSNLNDASLVISAQCITLKYKIGEGFYGEVSKASYFNPSSLTHETVAVKRLKSNQSAPISVDELKSELNIMKELRHKNIVRIIGLVEEPETMLVMEYVENGSLLNFVQTYRCNREELNVDELLKLAIGIAEGMEYLETQNIVHRDLAARNILVGAKRNVKITDFGLAQKLKEYYYHVKTSRNLPFRWYAIEAISKQKFSHKSDVWSYGVTLWEIFSYGENPQIPNIPDSALADALSKGHRLGITAYCPALLYELMRRCWEEATQARPTFSEIIVTLNHFRSEF